MNRHSNSIPAFMLTLAAVVPLLTSCGSGASNASAASPAAIVGSCNNVASGFCVEYNGADYKAPKMQKVCESQKLSFLAGGCPAKGRVGSCVVSKGMKSESAYRYYTSFPGFGVKPAGGVAAEAARQCTTLKGEWTAN